MPRWYVSALLVGIVTVCAVCLGLRWRVLESYGPLPTHPPSGTTAAPLLNSAAPALSQRGAGTPTAPAPDTGRADQPADPASDAAPWGTGQASTAADSGPSAAATAPAVLSDPAAKPAGAAPEYPVKPRLVRVNINTASIAQLQALPGVGPVLAQRIAAYRQQHGPFRSAASLQDVKGIGPKKFAKLQPWADV